MEKNLLNDKLRPWEAPLLTELSTGETHSLGGFGNDGGTTGSSNS